MMRRSAGVNDRAGGSAGSVRGSGSLFEVGNEFGNRPRVSRADAHETPFRIDDRGAEIVHDDTWRLTWLAQHAKTLRKREHIVTSAGGEVPQPWIGTGRLGVFFQHRRRVVLGI